MNNTSPPSIQLTDIVTPSAQSSSVIEILVLGLTVLALVVFIVVFWRWYQSGLQIRLRQLKHVQIANWEHRITTRMACFHMTALLKEQLGIHYLPPTLELPSSIAEQQLRWDIYTQRLHFLRYAPQSGESRDIDSLITETRYWLRSWP